MKKLNCCHRCDGRCIPHDWVSDGWPDCMDGADEASLAVDGKVMPYQLGCVQCAGSHIISFNRLTFHLFFF